jgi:hypothetical protein
MQRYSLRPPAYHRPHVSLSAGFPGSVGFLGNPSPAWYPGDPCSLQRTRPGYSVPGQCLALRAGPHCSPGDVMGCSLEHAVSCPAGESSLSHVSVSVLDQANNLRRLVLSNDDSGVSSCAYPYATLLGGIRREILRDRLSLPLHQLESQSPRWGGCVTRASRGEELHLYTVQVVKDLSGLSPSSLACRHFEGTDRSTARYFVGPGSRTPFLYSGAVRCRQHPAGQGSAKEGSQASNTKSRANRDP